MNIHHVMLDLETLGTKPGCPILSIGATTFLTPAPTSYYLVIQEGQAKMDNPDPDTIAWWAKQSEEARAEVFNNPNALHIYDALITFNNWLVALKQTPEDRIIIWGKGATFDEPILQEAMKRYGITPVWTFRDSMCFRTLAEVGKMCFVSDPEFQGARHNALHDAEHQAVWAEDIFKHIYPGMIYHG